TCVAKPTDELASGRPIRRRRERGEIELRKSLLHLGWTVGRCSSGRPLRNAACSSVTRKCTRVRSRHKHVHSRPEAQGSVATGHGRPNRCIRRRRIGPSHDATMRACDVRGPPAHAAGETQCEHAPAGAQRGGDAMSGEGQIVNSHLVGDHVRPDGARRALLASGAAAVLAAGLGVRAHAQRAAAPRERVLLRGGCVLTLDPRLGDFDRADVLIEGTTIAAVAPNLEITGDDVEVIDASRMIVMPGFVDTHRHMWQGALRNVSPDGLLSDYTRDITGAARSVFRPEDAYIGDLVSAL